MTTAEMRHFLHFQRLAQNPPGVLSSQDRETLRAMVPLVEKFSQDVWRLDVLADHVMLEGLGEDVPYDIADFATAEIDPTKENDPQEIERGFRVGLRKMIDVFAYHLKTQETHCYSPLCRN